MTSAAAVDATRRNPFTAAEADNLTKRIRTNIAAIHVEMDELQHMVTQARKGLAWQVLGYPSWTSYLADVIDLDVSTGRRREIVALLIPERLSQRAMAKILNVSQSTIRDDFKFAKMSGNYSPDLDSPKVVKGFDGCNYPVADEPEDPPPPPDPLELKIRKATRITKRLCEILIDVYADPEFTGNNADMRTVKTDLALALSDLEKQLWPTRDEIKAKQRKRLGRRKVNDDVVEVDFGRRRSREAEDAALSK